MPHHGHRRADARSLELHRAAFEKLSRHPELRVAALGLVERWLEREEVRSSKRWLEEWRDMLSSWTLAAMVEHVLDAEGGQVLRQCSPLSPVLTPRERWAVLREVNKRLAAEERGHSR